MKIFDLKNTSDGGMNTFNTTKVFAPVIMPIGRKETLCLGLSNSSNVALLAVPPS